MIRPGRPPVLRQTCFDDYHQIANLEQRHGLSVRDNRQWLDLWQRNPAFRAHPGWPLGWVLENDAREIVGSIGNIPLHYEFQGSTILTAAGRAWVADPAYRSYAPLLMDTYFAQKDIGLFLNTTVNSLAAEAFGMFGSLPVPAGKWDSASFWIVRRRSFARAVLRRKRIPFHGLFSYPAAAGLAVIEKLTGRPGLNARSGFPVEYATGFDGRFDVFWAQLRQQRPGVLLGNRSAEALAWHFRYPALQNKLWIATHAGTRGGAAIESYALFVRKDHPGLGITRARLVDFQSLRRDPESLEILISQALRDCEAQNIDVLEHVGRGVSSRQLIDDAAPYRRKLSTWAFFYKAAGNSLQRALANPEAWDPSSFDGDASL